jgi:aspartyl-tRNA(Asn)/glutamyl-tRNA(Gln) amidotransferase subunit A
VIAEPAHYLGVADLQRALDARAMSSVEVTRAQLARIAELNPKLGAYYTVFEEQALADAKTADRELAAGRRRGPLQGVPVALKDLFELGPTTAGSALRHDRPEVPPGRLVRALREQGAVILGKLATHEFALAAQSEADAMPPARNPWNPSLMPGGSSTGAGVAVAAGMAFGAYGTDTGGSVRLPAAHCSIVGFKPTFGLLGRSGIVPLAWSLDHAGPLARSVGDAALLFDAVRGPDAADPGSAARQPEIHLDALSGSAAGLRIAVPRDFWAPSCDAEVAAATDAALAALEAGGASVTEVRLGLTVEDVIATGYLVTLAEAATYHLPDLRAHSDRYGREFRLLMKTGATLPASAYLAAQRARTTVAARVRSALGEHDLLAMPTLGALTDAITRQPRPIWQRIKEAPAPVYTWLANLYGGPAISIPAGFSSDGRPVGFQLMGRPYDDQAVLAGGAAAEAALEFSSRHPLP